METTETKSAGDSRLKNPPIIEALIDIDCDMPPGREIAALQGPAHERFRDRYPKVRTSLVQEHQLETKADELPRASIRHAIRGFQFLQEDEKQLVQVRTHGFSFNRLAPYSSLDDYLPEVERTWRLFLEVAAPVQVRLIRLRYINRILLPMVDQRISKLEDYLKICPRLPDEERLTFIGFLDQHAALEKETGNQVNIVLTAQRGEEGMLPIVFDIEGFHPEALDPKDWRSIMARVASLRSLNNRVFRNTLTEQCLSLFQR
jgi:uncharacterized protein (TIGR04255 family)